MCSIDDLWRTWRVATEHALYGDGGFYRRTRGPAAHFRTSVHASRLFAQAVLALARSAGLRTVVDVGAGRGELVAALHLLDPALRLLAVEVADRPARLPAGVAWLHEMPTGLDALVVANEWLDNVPVDVVALTTAGPRLVEVDRRGVERPGPAPGTADRAWVARWWPLDELGQRAEVGRPRDQAWAQVLAALGSGVAVAVDYAHSRDSRPPQGSLAGYADGRRVAPVPDGSCDITSHVALDACAAAGESAGATATRLLSQREALHALGVRGRAPDLRTSGADPAGYLAALRDAGEAAELTYRGSLGGFSWLVQSVGRPLPPVLEPLPAQPLTGTE